LTPRRVYFAGNSTAARSIDRQAIREEESMLGNSRVHPVLLATDLEQARAFYHDKLGLEILAELEHSIQFQCGGGTKLAVSKSTVGTADSQTQIGWEVEDLRAELEELRARGVKIEDYDLPELKTENGIADVGFALMAWIIDPGKNALAIMELKG
jgi:catechol 2,3-dioxygenase-like lactoylglutathione lyase family enzyme